MVTTNDTAWDSSAIRRAILLLGSHSPRVDDQQSTARALRLVWDIIHRRGAATEIFQLPGTMPLVVVGHGPVLLTTYLDDPHPFAQVEEPDPPSIIDGIVKAPGITRKAGLLSVLGAILGSDSVADEVTLAIEADRHTGSQAFAPWLDGSERQFTAAICEVADIPVPAPAIFLSNTGLVTVTVTLRASTDAVESVYGGVQPDIAHDLIATLASLKSSEGEVLIPGFYDGVLTPDTDGLGTLQRVAAPVGAWLTRGAPPSDDRLSSSHLTLGAFLAPSIIIRDVQLISTNPYLPSEVSATIDARVMPGQDATAVARAIHEYVRNRIPDASIASPILRPASRPPALDPATLGTLAPVIPVAAGNAPSGLLDSVGIPTIGFSTVWRDPTLQEEQVTLASIEAHAQTIQAIVRSFTNAIENGVSSQ